MLKDLVALNIYSSNSTKVINFEKRDRIESLDVESYKRSRKDLIVSFIGNSDIIYERVSISANIPDSELLNVLKSKVYEELDNSVKYNIIYYEESPEEDKRNFSLFIVNPNTVKYISKQLHSRVKYIHRIYPIPILIQNLYRYRGDNSKVETFIYLYRDSASLSIFSNGKLLYTKALQFSLLIFYEFFTSKVGELDVSYKLFSQIISDSELLKKSFRYRKALTSSLKHLFDEVGELFNYAKRNLSIDHIDQVHITSELGAILGVSEYGESVLGVENSSSFLKRFGIEPKSVDEMHHILLISQKLSLPMGSYLTELEPPPNFFLRESGKLLTVTFLSMVLSIIYPLKNSYEEWSILNSMESKTIEVGRLKAQYDEVSKKINSLQSNKIELQSMLQRAKDEYNSRFELLSDIYTKKVQYTMKGATLYQLSRSLNLFDVSITKLDYIEEDQKKSFKILAVSKDHRQLTKLIVHLVKNFSYTISITVINFEKIEGFDLYASDITVGINY